MRVVVGKEETAIEPRARASAKGNVIVMKLFPSKLPACLHVGGKRVCTPANMLFDVDLFCFHSQI